MKNSQGHLEDPNNNERIFGILFLVIVLVGAGFRFFQLGHESLWLDEMASGLRAQMSWSQMFDALTRVKANPPLHYILLKGWVGVFGSSEFSLRFLSAVFSVFSIVLFYHIAKMLFCRKAALMAAAILALSRYDINLAQEARCYALMGFLVLLSMYFLIRLYQTPTWGSYLGYILASVGMLYNHYYAPFVIIMQNLFVLTVYVFKKPISWKYIMYWFIGQVLIGLCYIPWVSVLWRAIRKIESTSTVLKTPGLANLLACLKTFSGGQRWAAILFLALACLSFFEILKTTDSCPRKSKLRTFYLVLLWLVVPMALPFLYSVYRAPIFSSRYTLISSYPWFLLVAVGITGIRITPVRYFLIGTILLGSLYTLLPQYFSHNKEEWRQMTSYIESKAQPGQALLFHAPFCGNHAYKFYAKRTDLPVLRFPKSQKGTYAVTESNVSQIEPLVQDYSHVWLILSHSRDKKGLILEKMREQFSQQEHISFKGIEVYLLVKKEVPDLPASED